MIYLNVGGVYYATSRTTLAMGGSFFSALESNLEADAWEVFIDRDPTHFRYVLNWLRGVRVVPEDDQSLQELLWEADFYGLTDLRTAIVQTPRRASALHTLQRIASNVA